MSSTFLSSVIHVSSKSSSTYQISSLKNHKRHNKKFWSTNCHYVLFIIFFYFDFPAPILIFLKKTLNKNAKKNSFEIKFFFKIIKTFLTFFIFLTDASASSWFWFDREQVKLHINCHDNWNQGGKGDWGEFRNEIFMNYSVKRVPSKHETGVMLNYFQKMNKITRVHINSLFIM